MNEAVRLHWEKMVPSFWHMPKEVWAVVSRLKGSAGHHLLVCTAWGLLRWRRWK